MPNEHPLFRATHVKAVPSAVKISRDQSMVWMGSCFVESMAPFLHDFRYNALTNPFGVVFNPLIIGQLLRTSTKKIQESTFEKDKVWMNFLLGAPYYAPTREELNNRIKESVNRTHEYLKNADWLVITWGTAFWYKHHERGMVGKCHKLPQAHFEKKRCTADEIVHSYKVLIAHIRKTNPDLKILLTISPVRHTRDGMEANAVSKATLRLAAEALDSTVENVFYFPAYEIMVDELRDYRFYEADGVHPTRVAIEYIWEQFSNQYFTASDREINEIMKRIAIQKQHRPLVSFGYEFMKWKVDLERKEAELQIRLINPDY